MKISTVLPVEYAHQSRDQRSMSLHRGRECDSSLGELELSRATAFGQLKTVRHALSNLYLILQEAI